MRAETTGYSAVVKTGITGALGLGFIGAAAYYGTSATISIWTMMSK